MLVSIVDPFSYIVIQGKPLFPFRNLLNLGSGGLLNQVHQGIGGMRRMRHIGEM